MAEKNLCFIDAKCEACQGEGCEACQGTGIVGRIEEREPTIPVHPDGVSCALEARRIAQRLGFRELGEALGVSVARASQLCRGAGEGWFLLAVRFDELANVGLYDPDQFDSGRLLKIDFPYGGAEHYLHSPQYEGVLGYSVTYRGNFGYQILDAARTVAAIVNIDEKNKPTPTMIDDMLAQVRSKPGTTYIFTSPRGKIYGINPYKVDNVHLVNGDTNANTRLESWAGISIVESHNISNKIPHITVK